MDYFENLNSNAQLGRIFPFREYNFTEKEKAIRYHIAYMFNRTHAMFEWKNLPESITPRVLELYLQMNGNACFYKYNDELYVFVGGLGGAPDVYYMPTICTVANPALNFSKALKINEECIIVPNDTMYIGLVPLFRRYATLLAENELSMSIGTINTRVLSLLTADNDRAKANAEKYLEQVKAGKLGVIGDNSFFDGIKAQPYAGTANSNYLTNLIEFEQYCKASFYNEIGLNANYNMKRESLNSSESQMNNDALLPLVDDMLECRKRGIEKVNEMFGTNISVELASSWEDNEIELAIEHNEPVEEEPAEEDIADEITEEKGDAKNDAK